MMCKSFVNYFVVLASLVFFVVATTAWAKDSVRDRVGNLEQAVAKLQNAKFECRTVKSENETISDQNATSGSPHTLAAACPSGFELMSGYGHVYSNPENVAFVQGWIRNSNQWVCEFSRRSGSFDAYCLAQCCKVAK